jgi:predicted nucleic acid-binding protein
MIVFADTSTVLRLTDQSDSSLDTVGWSVVVVSALCQVEVVAHLWNKVRHGESTEVDAVTQSRRLEQSLNGVDCLEVPIVPVRVTEEIIRAAFNLSSTHPISSTESIHLATSLEARRVEPACEHFATTSESLSLAAFRSGMNPIPSLPHLKV